MPRDLVLNPEFLRELFHRAFKGDSSRLDQEWRIYMDSLKPDLELIRETSKT